MARLGIKTRLRLWIALSLGQSGRRAPGLDDYVLGGLWCRMEIISFPSPPSSDFLPSSPGG
eukprot:171435-Amorphochlora_amoeboformis.AAC.2